jgi:uncharacterized damage-inducible protein DinB
MTWTVPDLPSTTPPQTGAERESLQGWLDFHRTTLQHKCAGLDHAQLSVRPVGTSLMSLLGLVRHMTDVERWWFRMQQRGEQLPFLYDPDLRDADFTDLDTAAAEEVFATFWQECAATDAAVADLALEATFVNEKRGTELNLRWVYLHMIEEYARHNGHADLIRELVDGTTEAG